MRVARACVWTVGHPPCDEAANNGETPLHHAAFHGLEKEVEALLAAGADTQLAGPSIHSLTHSHSFTHTRSFVYSLST